MAVNGTEMSKIGEQVLVRKKSKIKKQVMVESMRSKD